MTYGALKDQVILITQELNEEPEFNINRILQLINHGYVDFARRTMCMSKTFSITTVANQAVYDVDDSVLKVHTVRYVEDSSTEYGYELKPYPGGYGNLPRIKSYGTPSYYFIRHPHDLTNERDIGTWPIIGTSDKTLEYDAFYTPGDLSIDGVEPAFNSAYHHALYEYAVWKAYSMFAHKKPEYARKGLEYREYYMERVSDALRLFSTFTEQNQETVDVYS